MDKTLTETLKGLHVSLRAAVPNARWVEYILQLDEIATERVSIRNGKAVSSEVPGLGIAWDFDAIARRTADGSRSVVSA